MTPLANIGQNNGTEITLQQLETLDVLAFPEPVALPNGETSPSLRDRTTNFNTLLEQFKTNSENLENHQVTVERYVSEKDGRQLARIWFSLGIALSVSLLASGIIICVFVNPISPLIVLGIVLPMIGIVGTLLPSMFWGIQEEIWRLNPLVVPERRSVIQGNVNTFETQLNAFLGLNGDDQAKRAFEEWIRQIQDHIEAEQNSENGDRRGQAAALEQKIDRLEDYREQILINQRPPAAPLIITD